MAWTKYQLFLAGLMLVTGSINTLATKWADTSYAVGVDGKSRLFNHPFLQAVGMFMGEMTCLVAFHVLRLVGQRRGQPIDEGNQRFNPLIFWPASLCDMTATSLMYVGLNLTFASSFQMLRGAVMIFTALLSVTFLRRVIRGYMWGGMFLVVAGLILVGVSDIIFGKDDMHDRNGIISGDLLIIMAQIITATQMVYEERFITKHNVPPLQAVGWEGIFGFFTLGVLLVPMYFIKIGQPFSNDPDGRMENVKDAFIQMGNNYIIIIATIGNILSIAFFNFSGISVTKEMSATTRMVLDSARTVVIWVVSLSVKWQPFTVKQFFVQMGGFLLLIAGMCIYNDIIFRPLLQRCGFCQQAEPVETDEERERLISPQHPAIQDNQNVDYKPDGYGGTQSSESPVVA